MQFNFSSSTEARLGGLLPPAYSWIIAQVAYQNNAPLLILCKNEQEKQQLIDELEFFTELPIFDFADWETLPYDRFSPHQDIVSLRLKLLNALPQLTQGIVITSMHSLMNPLCPPEFLHQHVLLLEVGQKLNLTQKKAALTEAGYQLVEQVLAPGDFAVRGSIIDIYPMGAATPFRIDLFGDDIDSIRNIDLESQRSGEICERIEILPAHEFSLDVVAIKNFTQSWQTTFAGKFMDATVLKTVERAHAAPGLEYYLPLFYGHKQYSLFNYLPKNTLLFRLPDIYPAAQSAWQEIGQRFEEKSFDPDYPPIPRQQLFSSPEQLFLLQKTFKHIDAELTALNKTSSNQINLQLEALPDISFKQNSKTPWDDLKKFINTHQTKYHILFCADSEGRMQILSEHLSKIGATYTKQGVIPAQAGIHEDYPKNRGLTQWIPAYAGMTQNGLILGVSPQHNGFIDHANQFIIITEAELFPFRATGKVRKTTHAAAPGISLKDLSELNVNDLVVHLEHGIGRYLGLSKLTLNETPQEFLTLEYMNGDKLYVPIQSLNLISRYSQGEFAHALNSLGSDKWQKTKEKAAKRITDVAAELLTLYAERMSKQGFACQPPNDDYLLFSDAFPYEETDDQLKAINDVIKDLTTNRPMDRLLCGDVGFGKTEVAMRAAFLAVQSGKQVAILVPTTLLAEQHAESFANRFANWGVVIKHFSRLTRSKDETQILAALREGKVDILIGTHKLLNSKVQFKNLGLVIIDEEHRFGVKDKEHLKALKTEVHMLAMTATPIPRSLNMSLSMLRDLSLIATPPAKRLPIKTFVKEYNKGLIKEAILREVLRGGQVYYVHNNVSTIGPKREELEQLLPNLKISIAHGQMKGNEIERIMADFYHNRIQVLVCTTIIETGIDVPNANTLIVERSDEFGLAQLHQLRGRVGRSHHQAYAYFLSLPYSVLNRDAQKRLDAIVESSELGSGFTLATHDLEIRGAGEILGDEQSGQMTEIGVNLYLELLDRAVSTFKQGKTLSTEALLMPDEVEIELHISRMLPEDYINDVHTRLKLYQRLLQINTMDALEDFRVELIDRFGPLPEAAHHLLLCQNLKLRARMLGIKKIEAHAHGGKIELTNDIKFDPLKLIRLVQSGKGGLQLRGEHTLLIKTKLLKAPERIAYIENILAQLS
jgi:transcription-repair coupling factor (superfamily II helicase)